MTTEMPPGGWSQPIPAQPPITARYAGWWSRVGASLIDGVIVGIPVTVLGVIIFAGAGVAFGADDGVGIAALVLGVIIYLVLLAGVLILYAPMLMKRPGEHNGQTWGKQLLGIRVVRTNGVPMDFTHSALREAAVKGLGLGFLATIIPVLPYLLDFLWPLWDDENRAIHDMVVGTRVVEA